MAVLTVQQLANTGVIPTYAAADVAGDSFDNAAGKSYLHVKNASGGSINVTVNSQALCNYGFDHDIVVAIGAGVEKKIGPFMTSRFNDTSGRVVVSYSAVTSVTVGAFTE